MRSSRIRSLCVALALATSLCGTIGAAAGADRLSDRTRTPRAASVHPDVAAALARSGSTTAIVLLREDPPLSAPDDVRRQRIAAAEEAVLESVGESDLRLRWRYEFIAAFSATVTRSAIAKLAADPRVVAIEPNVEHVPMLAESVPIIHADVVRDTYGLTGEGISVAVLDTGIDATHPDLSDDIVAQHCFSMNGGCGQNNATEGTDARDESGHGTGVSGIITAKGVESPPGVAPDAGIVAVRVFDDKDKTQTEDVIQGLEWVVKNRSTYKIRIVNMSLGSATTYSGSCDGHKDASEAYVKAINLLNSLGIAIFAASGNGGATSAMSMPACFSNVVSVGATYDADFGRMPPTGTWGSAGCFDRFSGPETVTCFTNVSRRLSMVAPGAMITHPRMRGGKAESAGTSDASPMAAAVAALLLQADGSLRPLELERTLQNTGTMIQHPTVTNLSFALIDAQRAVEFVKGITPQPSPAASGTPTRTPSPAATTPATAEPGATATPTTPAGTDIPPPETIEPTATATTGLVVLPTATRRPTELPRRSIYLPLAKRGA